jgi:hypothetical protein
MFSCYTHSLCDCKFQLWSSLGAWQMQDMWLATVQHLLFGYATVGQTI